MRVACILLNTKIPISRIAEHFLRFSPQICVSKEALFVEIGRSKSLFDESIFVSKAKRLLKKLNIEAEVRIAKDITDSLAFARFRCDELKKLPLNSLHDFTDPFDRDPALRKSVQNLINSFQNLGIKNLDQFVQLPVSDLISRFGIVGRFCYQRVRGETLVNWPNWKPDEIIFERKEFSYFEFYGELEPILFELKSQLDLIFLRLFVRGKRAQKMEIEIKCEKISTHPNYIRKFNFNFFAPQGSTKGTLRIFKERLTKEFEKNPILSPVEAVQTTVIKSVHYEGGQKNIFSNEEEKTEQINSLHNQLIEILGIENVFQAELVEDRRPEKSWVKRFDRPHEAQEKPVNVSDVIPERPTYLLKKPIRIEITAGFAHIRKKRYRILHWDNVVEKITGGWFEKPTEELKNVFDRNYYHVEIEGHQRITVFETPNREYFLHGYYG